MAKKKQYDSEDQNPRYKFGKAVRRRRRELDLTQEDLAEKANLARTYITNLEAGKINASLETIVRLAEALEVSVWALLLSSGL